MSDVPRAIMPRESTTQAVEVIESFVVTYAVSTVVGNVILAARLFFNTVIMEPERSLSIFSKNQSRLLILIHRRCAGGFPTTRAGAKLCLEVDDLLSRSLFKLAEDVQEVYTRRGGERPVDGIKMNAVDN